LAARRRKPRRGRRAKLEESVRLYRAGLEHLAQQASKVSVRLSGQVPPMPDALIADIRAVADAARELQEHAKRVDAPVPRPTAPRPPESHAMSRQEIHKLLMSRPAEGELNADHIQSERYAYHVAQWMGRCAGTRLPRPEDFEQVMCHDLSRHGVSFYADGVQVGQYVVLAIGMGDDSAFVVAEAMHRRAVNIDGKLAYLIGCRFGRRLTHQNDREVVAGYRRLLFETPAELQVGG
jgi:hypothetical protein